MTTLPPNFVDCEQGSRDWHTARCGCVGSSRVAKAIAKLKRKSENGEKGEPTGSSLSLRYEVAGERLTGRCSEHYVSKWMEEGKDKEPQARTEYEIRTGASVDLIGYVYHPWIKWAGASPDGLVGEDGLVEFKCPKLETHLGYLIDNVIPEDYHAQMLWQLVCTDRKWNDFCSYHPDMPEPYQIFLKRMDRTEELTQLGAQMEEEVIQFIGKVEELLAKLKDRR